MLYFAYGSNLNINQMSRRCPAAEPLTGFELPGWRLVFRGVADIVEDEGAVVQGGVWRITAECKRALDRYEGYRPNDAGMYSKVYVEVAGLPDGEETVMFYVMNSTGIMPPAIGYFSGIKEGYQNFDLPTAPLMDALDRAYADKAPSHVERRRLRRTGRPARAPRPSAPDPVQQAGSKKSRKRLKAARKAIERMKKEDARAIAKAAHDPWADTSFARPKKTRANLTDWLNDRYYNGERV